MAFAAAIAAPLWLAACHSAPEESKPSAPTNRVVPVPGKATNAITPVDPAPATRIANAAAPAAPILSEQDRKGEKGARALLAKWASALERGDWATARAQWGHGGADSGLDSDAFARSYARYQHLSVTYGDGDAEGGAGSIYYQVPVTIEAVLRDGRVAHLVGPVTLRRVNDVDGATPEELAWHISQSDLEEHP